MFPEIKAFVSWESTPVKMDIGVSISLISLAELQTKGRISSGGSTEPAQLITMRTNGFGIPELVLQPFSKIMSYMTPRFTYENTQFKAKQIS